MFISLALNWETFVGRCAGLIAPDMISLSLGQVCEAHNLFAADIPSIKRRRGKHIREQWMRGPAFVCACRWEWERKTPQRIMKIYRCFNFCSFRFLSPTQTTTLGENFKCKQWLMGINGRRQPKTRHRKYLPSLFRRSTWFLSIVFSFHLAAYQDPIRVSAMTACKPNSMSISVLSSCARYESAIFTSHRICAHYWTEIIAMQTFVICNKVNLNSLSIVLSTLHTPELELGRRYTPYKIQSNVCVFYSKCTGEWQEVINLNLDTPLLCVQQHHALNAVKTNGKFNFAMRFRGKE